MSYASEDYVAHEYGLSSHYGYEIDHLIPLELGGSNSVRNLWPEPYNSPYGATQKDGLEDYLLVVADRGPALACQPGQLTDGQQHEAGGPRNRDLTSSRL